VYFADLLGKWPRELGGLAGLTALAKPLSKREVEIFAMTLLPAYRQ
jgi:hypothetical protein